MIPINLKSARKVKGSILKTEQFNSAQQISTLSMSAA